MDVQNNRIIHWINIGINDIALNTATIILTVFFDMGGENSIMAKTTVSAL